MAKRPNKNTTDKTERFTKMISVTMDTTAWRALSSTAQALYPFLRLEWKGKNYCNNGEIKLSTRQAAYALGVNVDTAARAFRDLQAKGFIVMTNPGCLGIAGKGISPSYELTELGTKADSKPRKLFKQWDPKREFPVHKLSANNPNGRNGREKNNCNIVQIAPIAN
jgi:DNA-binding transcriptional MocR family regulator